MSCKAVNIPGMFPGWGCCKCRTYNGDQRDGCKNCNHPRCDSPVMKKIPILEKDGVRVLNVPVVPVPSKDKMN